jgi:hypothetical protein
MPERQSLPVESRLAMMERELDRLESQIGLCAKTDVLDKLDQKVSEHSKIAQEVAVLRAEFSGFATNMHEDFADVKTDVAGLRRTLIGASITVMIAAVGFAITTLAVFGAPG